MTFSKTLHPADYALFGYYTYLFDSLKDAIPCVVNHFHRRWEYGMALAFLQSLGGPDEIKTVLDVGGAGSLFPPIAALCGYEVTIADPSPVVHLGFEQSKILDVPISCFQSKFPDALIPHVYDAVVAISTIEHVEDDRKFIDAMKASARKAIFLTTDFSMDGGRYSPDHLRTYTPKDLRWLGEGKDYDLTEYEDNGNHVFGYNFASVAMVMEHAQV